MAASDLILLLGWQADVEEDYTYDTSKVEAFLLPKGVAVELYATTLHYAPATAGKAVSAVQSFFLTEPIFRLMRTTSPAEKMH